MTPADVDHVILTHAHADHVGNVGLFENATFTLARAELDLWTGPYAANPVIAQHADPVAMGTIVEAAADARVNLVSDAHVRSQASLLVRSAGTAQVS